jgi:hypothetical protein
VVADKGNPHYRSNSIDYRHQLPFGGVLSELAMKDNYVICELLKSVDIPYLREYGAVAKSIQGVRGSLGQAPSFMTSVSFPLQNAEIVLKCIFM